MTATTRGKAWTCSCALLRALRLLHADSFGQGIGSLTPLDAMMGRSHGSLAGWLQGTRFGHGARAAVGPILGPNDRLGPCSTSRSFLRRRLFYFCEEIFDRHNR